MSSSPSCPLHSTQRTTHHSADSEVGWFAKKDTGGVFHSSLPWDTTHCWCCGFLQWKAGSLFLLPNYADEDDYRISMVRTPVGQGRVKHPNQPSLGLMLGTRVSDWFTTKTPTGERAGKHESHLVCWSRKMSQDLLKGGRGWNDEYFKFYESNMNWTVIRV